MSGVVGETALCKLTRNFAQFDRQSNCTGGVNLCELAHSAPALGVSNRRELRKAAILRGLEDRCQQANFESEVRSSFENKGWIVVELTIVNVQCECASRSLLLSRPTK